MSSWAPYTCLLELLVNATGREQKSLLFGRGCLFFLLFFTLNVRLLSSKRPLILFHQQTSFFSLKNKPFFHKKIAVAEVLVVCMMGTLDMKTGREKTWPEYCWVESFWQHLILTAFWYSSGLKFPWKILSLRAKTKITTINILVVYGDKLKCLTFLAESFEIFNLKIKSYYSHETFSLIYTCTFK